MPSTSPKQKRFMAAVAHSPKFAQKVGVPVSVGKDFNNADLGISVKPMGGGFRHSSGQFHSDPFEKGYTKP